MVCLAYRLVNQSYEILREMLHDATGAGAGVGQLIALDVPRLYPPLVVGCRENKARSAGGMVQNLGRLAS